MRPYNRKYYNKQLEMFNNKSKLFNKTPEGVFRTFNNCNNVIIGDITIHYNDIIDGRIDGYLYKDFTTLYNVPALLEDNNVWMSITPMEVDSHWIPICLAFGKVGVAGLGLGYYIQNILDKPEVEEVIVYEINQTIIDLYLQNFGDHKKLTIINKNALNIENESFDFFYNDIYRNVFDGQAVDDMETMLSANSIDVYFFWGMEGYIIESIRINKVPTIDISVMNCFIEFYESFEQSEFSNLCINIYIDNHLLEKFINICR